LVPRFHRPRAGEEGFALKNPFSKLTGWLVSLFWIVYSALVVFAHFCWINYFALVGNILEKRHGRQVASDYVRPRAVALARHCYTWFGPAPKVDGLENVPSQGGFLLVGNHTTALDAAIFLGFISQKLFFVVKKEMKHIPGVGTMAEHMGLLIDRKNPQQAAGVLKHFLTDLRDGKPFGLFPEGTRSVDGKMLPFQRNSLKIAMLAKVPVVPVAILGNEKTMPKGTFTIRPAKVHARVLPPVDPNAFPSEQDLSEHVHTIMEQTLEQLAHTERK